MPRTLVVTNDFPPRVGGVQQYVWNLTAALPPDRVAVLAPNWPGWREWDASQPFAVHRFPSKFLWPTGDLLSRIRSLCGEHGAEVVLFGHGVPLPLSGPSLVRTGTPYVVLTHGVEVWGARTPGLAGAMRVGFSRASAVTAVSSYTSRALRALVPPEVPLSLLHPGVDAGRFAPGVDGSEVRSRLGLEGKPVVLCVSRLVPRKGQDVLIAAMPVIRRLVPQAVLLLVGDGPYRPRLEAAATEGPPGAVVFAGEVPDKDLPSWYAACDVFAMPCRSRWGGLEVEGFGIVFLEAAAAGKPVVVGRSGGAADAVADGSTGVLVEGTEPKAVALTISRLLLDPVLRERLGAAGRARVEAGFTWADRAGELASILSRAVS